ncbi:MULTISPECIES: efflux RND transporter periplasmic adaptor subunit [Adhaeribacter]|uniref:RND transporter n=2 Tax=Adhaeribacter TaxID=299566 RepID=A0A512B5U1_9BACT|nr:MULTISPECIES: efflux RND transporter periplasmic adaptor subunit [Adhaeribacter]KAA5542033.1 efflux RND transporter periplasmic adaptor subunit [Adhaeribacter rhizoryzae]GEO07311.1 RND transporter [Adhaeribacter aerolatus]
MKKILKTAGVWLVALLIVACTNKDKHEHHEVDTAGTGTTYTCPMHPQIVESAPGSCPICGMDLVPVKKQPATEKNAGSIMLSETQMQLGNISTRPVQMGQVGSNTILTGRLAVDQTQADLISSRAAGRIERLYVKETGRRIQKGQPLYDLYSESLLTLEQEYLLALDQVKAFPGEKQFASVLAAAKKKLLLMGLSPAQVNRVAHTRQLDARITFLAPTSGIVTEIAAAEGVYVAEGSLLYRLSRFNTIWVEAELYAQEAGQIQVGTPIEVTVPGQPAPIKTKVSFINPEFRQNSQVVVARAKLPNPKGALIPGTQATINLPAPTNQALTLPLDAVIRDSRGAHVWVKTGENTFNSKMVTLGPESANQVAIASGLSPNDTVVVTGAYLLYSEYVLKKGTDQMAGHNH